MLVTCTAGWAVFDSPVVAVAVAVVAVAVVVVVVVVAAVVVVVSAAVQGTVVLAP